MIRTEPGVYQALPPTLLLWAFDRRGAPTSALTFAVSLRLRSAAGNKQPAEAPASLAATITCWTPRPVHGRWVQHPLACGSSCVFFGRRDVLPPRPQVKLPHRSSRLLTLQKKKINYRLSNSPDLFESGFMGAESNEGQQVY